MAKCFLFIKVSPKLALMHAQGKERMGSEWHTVYFHEKGEVIKGYKDVREELVGLSQRWGKDGKVFLGSKGAAQSGVNTLYVVGSKESVVQVFREAGTKLEFVVSPDVYIGVFKFSKFLTQETFVVCIEADVSGERNASQEDFRYTNVTGELNLQLKDVSAHPLEFALPLKNILDRYA
jgi:hypothetical protein